MKKAIPAIGMVFLMAGCVQPYYGPTSGAARPPGQMLATQDQTAGVENTDRINRFRRLAAMQGSMPPIVEQLSLPPNSVSYMSGPVPVVRVVFDERAFFDFNSDAPRPESGPILDLIAENMRRDVGDAAVTVLGHTDAVGTDAYNIDLSRRRAANVMTALMQRGVNPEQLSEVAIGKSQPIAPNDTEEGRARNRRVEFLVSSGIDANLASVQQRFINQRYFSLADGRPAPVRKAVLAQVFKMRPDNQDRRAVLEPTAQKNPLSDADVKNLTEGSAHKLSQEPNGRIVPTGTLTLQTPREREAPRNPLEPEVPFHILPLDPVNQIHPDPLP